MKLIASLTLLCLFHALPAARIPEERQSSEAPGPAVVTPSTNQYTWEEHKLKYGLEFSDDEEVVRRGHFDAADTFIQQYNSEGGHTASMAHNHLSHKSDDEIKQLRGAIPPPPRNATARNAGLPALALDRASYPSSLDWRDKDGKTYVNNIKDQGECGSCWTFSATASLESRWAILNGWLPSLSEQNLVDCVHTGSSDSSGCNGGWYTNAWDYVASYKGFAVGSITGTNPAGLPKKYSGQDLESYYKYTGEAGTCAFKANYIGAYTSDYKTIYYNQPYSASHDIAENSPSAMIEALQTGPISVAIDASGNSFTYYSAGTLKASECGTNLDHAVNVIGYGSDSNGDYWLLRNSWGTTWGLEGYFKFARTSTEGSEGTCGVQKSAAYPNVETYNG